jgi:hypothetical protein
LLYWREYRFFPVSLIFGSRTSFQLFQITTDHFFSIDKARQVLGYDPAPCGPDDWYSIQKHACTFCVTSCAGLPNCFLKIFIL